MKKSTVIAYCALFFSVATASVPHNSAAESERESPVVKAVQQVMPAVVNIRTERVVEIRDPFSSIFRDFWSPYHGNRRNDVRQSLGSGVVIHRDGYVLTNNHVIKRATKIMVKFANGQEYEAKAIASSPQSDLALLKIILPQDAPKSFAAATFAQDDDLLLGESVIALGNPFGLGGSVSKGILSSKDRQAPQEDEKLDMSNWLQTDAAINPGNSGGPLINVEGKLIGINVAIHRQGQGIGFAIPIARVNETLGQLFTPENLNGLWLGLRLKLSKGHLQIAHVEPNSPAATAGLQTDDTIKVVNGKNVLNYIDWAHEVLRDKQPTIELQIVRAGLAMTLNATMQHESTIFNASIIEKHLGLSVQTLTQNLANQYGLSFYGGYLIRAVEANGPADQAGIEPGTVIQQVDNRQPEDLVAFARNIHRRPRGESVSLTVLWEMRRGNFIQQRSGVATVKIR